MGVVENPREIRGLAIVAQGGQIKRLSPTDYRVRSQSGNGSYLVARNEFSEWMCECPDFRFRAQVCKHIHAVEFSLRLREEAEHQSLALQPVGEEPVCPYCGCEYLVKRGARRNRSEAFQRYMCRACERRFVVNPGFDGMKYSPKAITAALDLYFKGVSFRKVADHLKQFYGRKPSASTVYGWLGKYVELANAYLGRVEPRTSGFWHVDEMAVKVKGRFDWMWNLMDDETRFWISSLISQRREAEDARRVFQDAKQKVPVTPKAVVHDGLQAYGEAFNKEFYTSKGPKVLEVRSVSVREKGANQRVERLHGTIRERDKVMRGLKRADTPITEGMRIAYNYLRPHMALGGKTPAQAAGVDLGLEGNRWLSLLKTATERKR